MDDATRLARRLGAGDLVGTAQPLIDPRHGLAVVGRLSAWVQEQTTGPAELLSVAEVAQMLGISARTVWRMVSAGEIPGPIRIGGSTRWRRSEVQAMIDLAETLKR